MARLPDLRHDPAKDGGHGTVVLRPPILLLLASLAVPAAAAAPCVGTEGPGKLRVTVEATGVRNAQGEVAFTVYPDVRSRFLARKGKIARLRIPAAPGTTAMCFWLAPGFYPFAIYHDENADHDFNRSLFKPKEGYGFSNDAPTTFGVPKFDKVRTEVDTGRTTVRIRMRYP